MLQAFLLTQQLHFKINFDLTISGGTVNVTSGTVKSDFDTFFVNNGILALGGTPTITAGGGYRHIRVNVKNANSKITISGNVTLYVVWVKSYENYVEELNADYLMMGTYDLALNNSKGNFGSCTTYYAAAKEFYDAMPIGAKNYFASSDCADAFIKMNAWAVANGETFNSSTMKFQTRTTQDSTLVKSDSSDVEIIVMLSVASLASALLFLKKKKVEHSSNF